MELNTILKAIHTKLGENASSAPVYREDYIPSTMGALRESGYIAWNFTMDYFVETVKHYTGTVEGELDVVCYARPRTTRSTLHTNVLDLWLPKVEGLRTSLGPAAVDDAYLHWVKLGDISELFSEKTGHQDAETPGIVTTFRIKISA